MISLFQKYLNKKPVKTYDGDSQVVDKVDTGEQGVSIPSELIAEELLEEIRYALREEKFDIAVEKSNCLVVDYPMEPRAWRLSIEAHAKYGSPPSEVLSLFRYSYGQGFLLRQAGIDQAYHVVTSLLKASRVNETSDVLSLKQPSFRVNELEGKSNLELIGLATDLFSDPSVQVGDRYASSLGGKLAETEGVESVFYSELWIKLLPLLLGRFKLLEGNPAYGCRNASSGLLLLRYYFAAKKFRNDFMNDGLAKMFAEEVTFENALAAQISGDAYDCFIISPKYSCLANITGGESLSYLDDLHFISTRGTSSVDVASTTPTTSVDGPEALGFVTEYGFLRYLFVQGWYSDCARLCRDFLGRKDVGRETLLVRLLLAKAFYAEERYPELFGSREYLAKNCFFVKADAAVVREFEILRLIALASRRLGGDHSQDIESWSSSVRALCLRNSGDLNAEIASAFEVKQGYLSSLLAVVESKYHD